MKGLGSKQLNPDGSLRFPFNPGPAKGKYPGLARRSRHKRIVKSELSDAVAMSLMAKMAAAFTRFRHP